MLTPFSIDPARIATLPANVFTRFCNDLIRAEAGRMALPQAFVDDTVRETVPDGGIDARIHEPSEDPPALWVNWLPTGGSAWQYKSGSCPSAEVLACDEFTKPEVQKAVERGDAYCFLTAASVNARKKGKIRRAIANLYQQRGQSPKGVVYSADDLAKWAQQHLGPAARYLDVPVSGWMPYDQWRENRNFRNEFFPDQSRADLMDEIRRRVRAGEAPVTVLGRAGMGKSRAALEAVAEDGIRQRVLYLPDAATLDPQFFWFLRNEAPEAAGVLVIDEYTATEYQRLRDLIGGLPPGVAVVFVGPREHDAIGDLELGELPVAELAKVVGDFAGSMPESQRAAIAARCGGSPKLVAYVSEEIERRGGDIAWNELERVHDVAGFVNTRLFPVGGPVGGADSISKVMRALCLFTRLGWRDEVELEGRVATGFFGVDWTDAKLAAEVTRRARRGLAARPLSVSLARHTRQLAHAQNHTQPWRPRPGRAVRHYERGGAAVDGRKAAAARRRGRNAGERDGDRRGSGFFS